MTAEIITPRTNALSWDLYGGLSGVALFLAELFAQTGIGSFRRTALGAIRCANEQVERRLTAQAPTAVSFYGGVAGAAYATWRVGELTGERALTGTLVEAVSAAASSSVGSSEGEDFLGRASAIGALTVLARHAHLPQFRELAIAIGRELCRSELMTRYATHQSHTSEPALTGLAHGAAGVGLSLLELHAETGEDEFLDAAHTAFAYEDRLFSAASGNWPDLRQRSREGPASRPRFAIAWCHGAPGIALSRLRASQIETSRRSHYLEYAQAALETTRHQVKRTLPIDGIDRTACHGTAGLIDTLLTGGLVLHDYDYEAAAREAAVELALAITSGDELRSGTLCGGPNPSLMLGTAGVGYHLLRVHSPHTVPSLLTVPTA